MVEQDQGTRFHLGANGLKRHGDGGAKVKRDRIEERLQLSIWFTPKQIPRNASMPSPSGATANPG